MSISALAGNRGLYNHPILPGLHQTAKQVLLSTEVPRPRAEFLSSVSSAHPDLLTTSALSGQWRRHQIRVALRPVRLFLSGKSILEQLNIQRNVPPWIIHISCPVRLGSDQSE